MNHYCYSYVALALGSLVCQLMSLVAFEICWIFGLRNFLTLLAATAVIGFFVFSAWAVGDAFLRYYCYMSGELVYLGLCMRECDFVKVPVFICACMSVRVCVSVECVHVCCV